jgi:hypothetical protein
LPGITYCTTDGNHEFVFSHSLKLPSTQLTDRTGKRLHVYVPGADNAQSDYFGLHWLYTLLAFENTSGWYLFSRNPYPAYDARNVNAMAVVTQEGGQTLDMALDGFAINNRNGQCLWPLALALMQSAADVDGVRDGRWYVNVARSRDWSRWLLEVHNPTDHPVQTTVRSSAHVVGLRFEEALVLAPGTSQLRDRGPAGD